MHNVPNDFSDLPLWGQVNVGCKMDNRQLKGRELADRGRVVKTEDGWTVYSLSSPNKYRVTLHPLFCSCPDFELRQEACKHIAAVHSDIHIKASDARLGKQSRPVPDSEPIKFPRKTYPQNWPVYNLSQTTEKHRFVELLHDLCKGIPEPAKKPGRGRPPLPLSDTIFSAIYKIYSLFSGRRFMSDLQDAFDAGHISQLPHFNSIFNCLESPAVAPILHNLIAQTSLPLACVESKFAVDSSGFSGSKFDRWYSEKYGRMKSEHAWIKVHVMVGTSTHTVTAARVMEKDSGDNPQLPPLVRATALDFHVGECSADKAYASLESYEAIEAAGGVPYIAFKSCHTGAAGGLWEKMFGLFTFRKEAFMESYHRRSNVESVFSMIKRKIGDSVRSKGEVAMMNEALGKIIAHNICVLIMACNELGIDAEFWQDEKNGNICAENQVAQILPFQRG